MWQYFLLILLPVGFTFFSAHKRFLLVGIRSTKYINNIPMKLFWLLLVLLLILRRTDVGIDVENYNYIFDLIKNHEWTWAVNRSPEIGWNLLNKAVSCVTADFRWILIITAFLSTIFLSRLFVKYSTDTSLSIALFVTSSCFIMLFSGLRQSISISVCMLSFEFAMRKKPLWFLACVMLAMSFHISAFMILFIYPLCHMRIKKKWLIWIVPTLIFVFIFNQQIFGFLGKVLTSFTDYDVTIQMTGSYTMLILLVLLVIFAFVIPDESSLDDVTMAMRNILLFSVALQMFAPLHSIAMRMNYYFLCYMPLVIPRVIAHRKKSMIQVATVLRYAMIIFFISYFFFKTTNDNTLQIFPYYFMWES